MDQESSAHPGSFQARGMALIELHKLKTLLYPLVVIALLRHSVGGATLSIACQVDRKTARRWLVALADLGYLTRASQLNGYTLTPQAETLLGEKVPIYVPFFPISDPTTTTDSHLINKIKDRESVVVVVAHPDGEKVPIHVPFFPIHVPFFPISQEVTTPTEVSSSGESPPKEITPPEVTTPSTDIPPDEFFVEKFNLLRSCGIGEPKRSSLARLSWVTPDFINKWKSHLRERGKLTPSLLIHCLEGRDPPPEPEPEEESVYDKVLKSDAPFSLLTNPEDM